MTKTLSRNFVVILCVCISSTVVGDEFDWKLVDGVEGLHFKTRDMSGVLVGQDTRDLGRGFGKHGIRGLTFKEHDLSASLIHRLVENVGTRGS